MEANCLQVSESRKCTGTVITVFGFNAVDVVVFLPRLCGGYFGAVQAARDFINQQEQK
jgi:hypothetical protein